MDVMAQYAQLNTANIEQFYQCPLRFRLDMEGNRLARPGKEKPEDSIVVQACVDLFQKNITKNNYGMNRDKFRFHFGELFWKDKKHSPELDKEAFRLWRKCSDFYTKTYSPMKAIPFLSKGTALSCLDWEIFQHLETPKFEIMVEFPIVLIDDDDKIILLEISERHGKINYRETARRINNSIPKALQILFIESFFDKEVKELILSWPESTKDDFVFRLTEQHRSAMFKNLSWIINGIRNEVAQNNPGEHCKTCRYSQSNCWSK